MGIYTVHIKGSSDEPSAFERAVFVRDGFAWWAFVFGPLWLLWHRAWLALLIWTLLQIGIGALVHMHVIPMLAQSAIELIIALALGFEGSSLRRYVLHRRGFRWVDVVQERRLVDAERRFFARQPHENNTSGTTRAVGSSAAPLVGLFPSAGA